MANNVFGNFLDKFKFSDEKAENRIHSNQIATDLNDGAVETEVGTGGGAYQQFMMNMDVSGSNQVDLINSYREISQYSTVDYAIEDIINEMVSFDEDEEPVTLDLTSLDEDLSENIRNKIYEKWDKVSNLLDLKETIHRRSRTFYIDGRAGYQKVIDKNKPGDGLLDIVEFDSRTLTLVRNKEFDQENKTLKHVSEHFIYDPSGADRNSEKKETDKISSPIKQQIILNRDSVAYITSGRTDLRTGYTTSLLHKAVRPANQLRLMENALVIYRITRAPERRLFYVDVANMPRTKAEEYMKRMKNMYRNKMSFDAESGTFKDSKHLMTMQEDYWLPRSSNGKGTEIDTLPGGQNLGDIDDIIYFQKELYKALNVPVSRLESESMMPLGRTAEISRDELKFSKFVSKIRKRLNMLFMDLLKTELILTKVLTIQEWDEIKHKVEFKYAKDMYLEEMRETEMLTDRLEVLESILPYVNRYFSNKFVREKVLKQTEEERKQIDKEIEEESKDPKYQVDDEDEPR